jgi:hypothetical protein
MKKDGETGRPDEGVILNKRMKNKISLPGF